MVLEKKTLDCAEASFENGILYVRFKEGSDVDVQDIEELYALGAELARGPYCILADIRKNINSTPEARAYGAGDAYKDVRLADAILTRSLAMKLIVNFYITVNKPKVPSRMFTDEKEAVEWLQGFLRKKLS